MPDLPGVVVYAIKSVRLLHVADPNFDGLLAFEQGGQPGDCDIAEHSTAYLDI
jgi:hypothetical protein